MEEFGCREGSHQGVDPHRHDEEDDGHSAFVELLVGKDPCRRIAEHYAECGVLDGHLKRKGECADCVSVLEELGEVAECETAGSVLKCIEHDQDQRQSHEHHQEYGVGQSPGASLVEFHLAYDLNVLRGDVDTYKVSLVPDVVCVHPDVVAVVGEDGEMIVVSFVEEEIYFT